LGAPTSSPDELTEAGVSGGPADAAKRAESSRLFVILVGLAAAVIVVLGLRQLSDIVGPAFLALVLVLGTQPIRLGLQRHGVPGWIS
ncbi:hypothetical protein, partial [Halalkalibacter lacteus]|uniref:hypothetical protein n=1 Tax=Halalkalibacter lacteus TaxID=3090663 RepID=UPI002FCA1D14